MIPIKDHNPSRGIPFVTYCLLAVNILVFLYMLFLPADRLDDFIYSYALIPALITSGQNLISLFTSMFIHGGFGHIFGNLLFLNIFGDNLENRFGHFKFLIFYLAAGLGAAFLQILADPLSEIPMIGASGAIAGVMGGYLLLFPNNPIDILFSFGLFLRKTVIPAWAMLFYWFFFQLISGLGSLGVGQGDDVAYFAHIGGFLTGIALTLFLKNKKPSKTAKTFRAITDY